MGYYADLSADVYKKSRAKFYVHMSEEVPYYLDPVKH